jgi:ribosomal protein L11 methyltransferase
VKTRSLWKISVVTTSEADEAVGELCQSVLGQAAISWTDVGTGEVVVSVYLPRQPGTFRPALAEGLAHLRRHRLKIGAGTIKVEKIRPADWAEVWKRHFTPIQVSPKLLIKPGWSKQRPGTGQAVVILDPGLSFGTGHHPTTSFCLKQLAAHRNESRQQSFLDMGTGSGILAIAAVKLGYTPVEAFDFDPEAIRVARANARKNRVLEKAHFHRDDLTRMPGRCTRQYDLICANLISTLLVAESSRIVRRLKPGGVLVLAGILKVEFAGVRRSYERLGLRLVNSGAAGEWRSGAFVLSDRIRTV